MANYVISYNAYRNSTEIVKNGTKLRKNGALCKGLDGKRLQAWFDKEKTWRGFGEEIDTDNNGKECNIDFIGREIDFIDLKEYFNTIYKSKKCTKFNLKSRFLSNDEDLLTRLSDFVKSAKKDSVFEDEQLESIEEYIDRIKSDPFVISVIATMSSGKSTLLNSLMHRELLPTGDDATTANIAEIYDNDNDEFRYVAFDAEGNQVCDGNDADLEKIAEINANKKIRTVRLYGNIPSVTADRMQLMLRDTPGPNNSEDENHREITESIISNARNMSTVIYVMNAINPRVDSDKALLHAIADEMKSGGKQANDRFFFVINKVDLRLKQKKQTLEDLLEATKNYLSQFGIENPRIFPVTASLACDVWKYRSGYDFDEITEWPTVKTNIEMFNADSPRVKFDLFASVSQCVKTQLDKDLKQAIEDNDVYEIALIHSGIKGLEYSLKEYMEKYAYPIKVSDALNDIIETIDEKKMRSKFMDALFDDDKKLIEVREKLGDIKQKKAERLAAKENFEESISNYSLPDGIKDKARQSVDDAFAKLIDDTLNKLQCDKLRKEEARAIVWPLFEKVEGIEKDLDQKIKDMIEVSVYDKGEEILKSYTEYLTTIKENMAIAEFDFGEVKALKHYDFSDLKDVYQKVTSTEDITKKSTRKIPNPKRHWYTFWKSKFIDEDYDEKIGTIEYVDKSAVRDDIIGIRTNAYKNVNEIVDEASALIDRFKTFFNEQLSYFETSIEKVIEELSIVVSEENMVNETKKQHKEKLTRLDEYLDKLTKITESKEVI